MKFSDFSNTTLNTEEIQKLEKRGFYVKTILPFTSLFLTILGYIPYTPITAALMILPTLFIVLFTKSQSIITILCFLLFPTLWIFYKASYDFIFYSKQFFYKKGSEIKTIYKKHEYSLLLHQASRLILYPFYKIGGFINLHSKKNKVKVSHKILENPSISSINLSGNIGIIIEKGIRYSIKGGLILLGLLISIPTIMLTATPIVYASQFPLQASITISAFILLYCFTFLLRYLVEHFHPLYAFGNLGEKIQKLTPQISTTSISIQDNFQKGMNYSILSDGFDSLSSTFSQIVSLVIGLEKIESRANKGNLFDSEKYINSLRTDITEPLISLRIFLEKQRDELIQSQKELSRVRVGGSDESTSIELASKRGEPLIQELTENIEKLSEMIGKIG